MRFTLAVIAVLVFVPAVVAQGDAVIVPNVVGLDVYAASKLLTRAGFEPRFEQVMLDTTAGKTDSTPAPEVAEYHVVFQSPDSGKPVAMGAAVTVRFGVTHTLRYWQSWVVPLLGDLKHQVSMYKATKPPAVVSVPAPGYPDELLKYKYNGTVGAEVFIDFDATPLAARIVQSSGYAEADSSALVAALQGLFAGGEHNSQPIRAWVPVSLPFQYQDMTGVPTVRDIEQPSGGE